MVMAGLVKSEGPMRWIVGLLLMGVFGRALAQDNPGGSEQREAENARRTSDQAIVKFNTDIADFPSWELFEAVVLAQVTPGLLGTCYTYQGGTVHVIQLRRIQWVGSIPYGPIAQGRKGDHVAEDGRQRMAADTYKSHVYRVSVQRKSGGFIRG